MVVFEKKIIKLYIREIWGMFEFSSTLRDGFAFKQHIAMATGPNSFDFSQKVGISGRNITCHSDTFL